MRRSLASREKLWAAIMDFEELMAPAQIPKKKSCFKESDERSMAVPDYFLQS